MFTKQPLHLQIAPNRKETDERVRKRSREHVLVTSLLFCLPGCPAHVPVNFPVEFGPILGARAGESPVHPGSRTQRLTTQLSGRAGGPGAAAAATVIMIVRQAGPAAA